MEILDPFLIFFVALIGAKIFGQIAKKIGQPSMIGHLLAGIILGPAVLSIVKPVGLIELFAELGIFFLMFLAGMEVELRKLWSATKPALYTAVGGIVLPVILGFGVGKLFGFENISSLFLGACLAITSIAMSADLLVEFKKMNTFMGETLIGAAIIDNIFGLMLLSLLAGISQAGTVAAQVSAITGFASLAFKIVAFFLIAVFMGYWIMPGLLRHHGLLDDRETLFTFALVFALTLGITARLVGLHGIIGAFIAGLFIRDAMGTGKVEEKLFDEFEAISIGLFTPFFFLWLGLMVNMQMLLIAPLLTIIIIGAAISGKFLGCTGGALLAKLKRKDSLLVGIGMNGRGAVELVVAELGRKAGILNDTLFAVIVIMALVTTFITPILFKRTLRKT